MDEWMEWNGMECAMAVVGFFEMGMGAKGNQFV